MLQGIGSSLKDKGSIFSNQTSFWVIYSECVTAKPIATLKAKKILDWIDCGSEGWGGVPPGS
jgi:hypothetical protein